MIRKYNIIFIYTVLFICLFMAGCASTSAVSGRMPDWVTSPKAVYPESNYLTYVGYGPDRDSAELSALSGISAVFGRDVIVNTVASKRMSEAVANGTVAVAQNRDFNQNIQNKVNVENLVGVEIEGYWLDKENNTWYSIAVLDKQKATSIYISMIEKNSNVVNDLILSTKKDFYSLQSLCAYDFAQEIAIENKKNLDKLFVIDNDVAQSMSIDVIAPEELAKKKFDIAGRIPININIKGDDGRYKSAFLDALADFGFRGSVDYDVRYVIEGDVSYNYEVTSDGKTYKCFYDFESSLIDTEKDINIFPINIRGRQAHRSKGEAENRAKLEIVKEIKETFSEQFNNYLDSFFEY